MTDPLDSLVAALRRGEEPALALYLAEKRPQLLAFIENHMGPGLKRKVEADDILQEVSAEAIRAFAATPLSDRDPFSWLCQLAERRIIDAHRHFFAAQKRAAAREQALPGSGGNSGDNASANLVNLLVRSMTTPSQAFSRNVREENLHAALAHLPDDQREALRLRYAENKASKEIAAALGKSDAAVRVMLTRALKRLEELLGPLE